MRSAIPLVGVLTVASAVLAAAPSPNAVYEGAWHLAQALGRVRCEAPSALVSVELRVLVERDLSAARVGMDTLSACGSPMTMPPLPEGAVAVSEFAQSLTEIERVYRSASRDSCHGREAFVSRVAFELGTAASDTVCAIATWNQPLPGAVAGRVRADLQTAKLTLLLVPGSSDWVRGLDAIERQLPNTPGDRVFRSLEESSAAIAAALSRQGDRR